MKEGERVAKAVSRKRLREKRIRLRVAASVIDIFGIAGSVIIVVLCILLLKSLSAWIGGDFAATFSLLEASVWNAVMVGM